MSEQEQQAASEGGIGQSASTVRLGGEVEHCHVCGVAMTEHETLRQNCGGDCLMCMAEAGDGDCIEAAFRLQKAEIARLTAIIDEVHTWAVCVGIATPDDMAQNLPHIVEITMPNDSGERGRACATSARPRGSAANCTEKGTI